MLALELKGQESGTGARGLQEQVPSGSRCALPLTVAVSPLQLTASEEEFLRTYAGVVNSQLSQLPQHSIDQGESRPGRPACPSQRRLVGFSGENLAPGADKGGRLPPVPRAEAQAWAHLFPGVGAEDPIR